jgi:hypothetical protein
MRPRRTIELAWTRTPLATSKKFGYELSMVTADQIIDALGGPARVAARLSATLDRKVGMTVVSMWKTSGRIPSWWLPHLAGFLAEDGSPLSADDLLELAAAKPKRKAEAA